MLRQERLYAQHRSFHPALTRLGIAPPIRSGVAHSMMELQELGHYVIEAQGFSWEHAVYCEHPKVNGTSPQGSFKQLASPATALS